MFFSDRKAGITFYVVIIGQTVGYNHESRDRDLPFTAKDEPATLPRVAEVIIITEITPWCTIVKNPGGVTMNDICTSIWKEWVSIPIRGVLELLLIPWSISLTVGIDYCLDIRRTW